MPTIVVDEPEHEPTVEELDEDIRNAGLDFILVAFPAGAARDGFREMLRSNAKMARYEKGKVLEGVVPIELEGKFAFIHPHIDTSWNFSRLMCFLDAVFLECSRHI